MRDWLALAHEEPVFGEAVAKQIAADLRRIGIDLNVELMDASAMFDRALDPAQRVPLILTPGWQKDILNASTWFQGLFTAGGVNFSLLGSNPDQLADWGYSVTDVPTVDARIDSCLVLVGDAQLRCWVALDQHLMENVVPWIPYVVFNYIQIVPKRIVRYSYGQFATQPALDQIALARES